MPFAKNSLPVPRPDCGLSRPRAERCRFASTAGLTAGARRPMSRDMPSWVTTRAALMRLPVAVMLLAALALVAHGLVASNMRTTMEASASHADCHGRSEGQPVSAPTLGRVALSEAERDRSGHDASSLPDTSLGTGEGHDHARLPSCCTLLAAAVLPQSGVVAHGIPQQSLRLYPSATLVLAGIEPDGPRKPPRTRDEV